MKRLNNLFVILFVLIGILSIAYIWNSEANRKTLEKKSYNQSQEINSLKNKISELEKEKDSSGNIMGTNTIPIGKLSGIVKLNDLNSSSTTIVCAQEKFTTKEFCTDDLLETTIQDELQYNLEIPKGQYFIYSIAPPNSDKTYYSKLQKCTDDDNCENEQRMLLEITEDETQENINLYF